MRAGGRWVCHPIDRAIERLSLRAKLAVLSVLGIGFALAVGAVGIAGLGHLNAAGSRGASIEEATQQHLLADRGLDALRADVLAALVATPDGKRISAAARQTALADAQRLRSGISELGGSYLGDSGVARQIVLFDQSAIATAALALDVVTTAGVFQSGN